MTILKKRILPLILSIAIVVAFTPALALQAFAFTGSAINITPSTKGVVKAVYNGGVAEGAAVGTEIQLFAISYSGYECKGVSVTETESGASVAVDEELKFEMPDAAVTVTATFDKKESTGAKLEVSPKFKKQILNGNLSKMVAESLGMDQATMMSFAEEWLNNSAYDNNLFDVDSLAADLLQIKASLPQNDVLDKAENKLFEAIATKVPMTILSTIMSLYPSAKAEVEKMIAPAGGAPLVSETQAAAMGKAVKKHYGLLFVLAMYMEKILDADFMTELGQELYAQNPNPSPGSSPTDFTKCVLNSDVFFKSMARITEVFQTKNVETIIYVFASEYPKLVDEMNRCFGAVSEGGNALKVVYLKFRQNIVEECQEYTDMKTKIANDVIVPKAVIKDGYVQLTWTSKYSDFVSYKVYRLNEMGDEYKYVKTVNKCRAKVGGVANAYRIRACLNYDGEILYSKYFKVKPTVVTPKGLTVKETSKYIVVSWKAVPGIREYIVCYSALGKRHYAYPSAGGVTTVKIKKVKNAKTYRVKVKAEYAVGNIDITSPYTAVKVFKIA